MRICIVGAGAIGCYLGAKLALSGEKVTIIARGKQLETIKQKGIVVKWDKGSPETAFPALTTNDMSEAGKQDLVILAVKGQNIPEIAEELHSLIGPETLIISAQNGLPWWYFQNYESEYENHVIEAVDPNGLIQSSIDPKRIIGSVLHLGAERVSVGVIRPTGTRRILLGELDGSNTQRIMKLNDAFIKAGFDSTVTSKIRSEIWYKLWGNLAHNPISALTRSTLREQCVYPPVRKLVKSMMQECQSVAEKLGVEFEITMEQRINITEAMGDHKTSMLQDIEKGRAVEAETMIGAVIELARMTGQPTPHIEAVYACLKLFDLKNREIII